MSLLFLCSGTIPAPSCRPSCQTSCCSSSSSGYALVAASRLSTALTMAPTLSCGMDLAPSPSGSGCWTRSSLSSTSEPERTQTPRLAVRGAAANRRASAQVVPSLPSGSHFQTRWYLHLLPSGATKRWSRNHFSSHGPVFLRTLDRQCHHRLHSSGTHTASGHCRGGWTSDLSSFRPTPELGGSPVETSSACLCVYLLYINAYVSQNKQVLSYLLSRLLPQYICIEERQGRGNSALHNHTSKSRDNTLTLEQIYRNFGKMKP